MRRVDPHVHRRLAVVVVGVLLLGGAWLAPRTVASRRTAAMQTAAGAAQAAVQAARADDALHWAPDELKAAERALRDALTRHRVEQVRIWPIPDSSSVIDAWSAAERAARTAAALARSRRADATRSATAQIDKAQADVAAGERTAATIHLGPNRWMLAAAKIVLDQARAYQRAGAVEAAIARARDAESLAERVGTHAAGIAARYADADTIARWQRWKSEAINWSRREGRAAIVVVKDAHLMTLFVGGEPVRSYTVELGFNWIADKRQEGDGATPEGRYRIVKRMDHLSSDYYKALLIDYPNAENRVAFARARRTGEVPTAARIGGLIEIHGGGGRQYDWTNGCVAVTNPDIDHLFGRVAVGTPVTIVGSDTYGPIAEFANRYGRDAASRRP
ncbi:MAG: L,D-transpeptidase family protein [Acidobacteria bacterium]|nr:L,D-transpeptidase family protein [Acidobacteriota bacterium]